MNYSDGNPSMFDADMSRLGAKLEKKFLEETFRHSVVEFSQCTLKCSEIANLKENETGSLSKISNCLNSCGEKINKVQEHFGEKLQFISKDFEQDLVKCLKQSGIPSSQMTSDVFKELPTNKKFMTCYNSLISKIENMI
ncbi:MAG: hypothetical protein MHMPM18_001814 [Marteilia pararefringens]